MSRSASNAQNTSTWAEKLLTYVHPKFRKANASFCRMKESCEEAGPRTGFLHPRFKEGPTWRYTVKIPEVTICVGMLYMSGSATRRSWRPAWPAEATKFSYLPIKPGGVGRTARKY